MLDIDLRFTRLLRLRCRAGTRFAAAIAGAIVLAALAAGVLLHGA